MTFVRLTDIHQRQHHENKSLQQDDQDVDVNRDLGARARFIAGGVRVISRSISVTIPDSDTAMPGCSAMVVL